VPNANKKRVHMMISQELIGTIGCSSSQNSEWLIIRNGRQTKLSDIFALLKGKKIKLRIEYLEDFHGSATDLH